MLKVLARDVEVCVSWKLRPRKMNIQYIYWVYNIYIQGVHKVLMEFKNFVIKSVLNIF